MAVRVIGNTLYIEFRMTLPNGKRVVVDESSGLKDNPRNRKRVEDKDKAIKYHLKNGTFDYLKFFPDGSKRKYFRNQNGTTFSNYWERWYSTLTVRYNTEKTGGLPSIATSNPISGNGCWGTSLITNSSFSGKCWSRKRV